MWFFFPPNIEKITARRNIPGLIKALSWKEDTLLHGQAARALGGIGDARAIEPLIDYYEMDEYRSDDAAPALVQIAARLHDAEITTRLVEYFIVALKPEGLVYSGGLVSYYGDDSEFNWAWAKSEHTRVQQAQRWNDDASRRALAAHTLGALRDPRAVAALAKCLKTHNEGNDAQTRLAAVVALGEIGGPGRD